MAYSFLLPFRGFTSYQLKLLAAATMMIDHIGVVFYPDVSWFRIVGRISFPLFVWLLVKGEAHTKDVWQYGLRLGALGIVSQPLYQIVLGANRPNILFQLLLGLMCLRLARNFPQFSLGIWLLAASIAWLIDLSYDAYGVALICMVRYFQPTVFWWLAWAAFHGVWAWMGGAFQLPVIVVPVFFWLANGQRGRQARWFYGFYPGHLALLWLVQYLKTVWELG